MGGSARGRIVSAAWGTCRCADDNRCVRLYTTHREAVARKWSGWRRANRTRSKRIHIETRRHGRAAWRCDTGLRGRLADGGLEVSFGGGSAGFGSLEKLPLCLVLTARNRSNARRKRAAHLALGYRGREHKPCPSSVALGQFARHPDRTWSTGGRALRCTGRKRRDTRVIGCVDVCCRAREGSPNGEWVRSTPRHWHAAATGGRGLTDLVRWSRSGELPTHHRTLAARLVAIAMACRAAYGHHVFYQDHRPRTPG